MSPQLISRIAIKFGKHIHGPFIMDCNNFRDTLKAIHTGFGAFLLSVNGSQHSDASAAMS